MYAQDILHNQDETYTNFALHTLVVHFHAFAVRMNPEQRMLFI
jgi:hypothetical protein